MNHRRSTCRTLLCTTALALGVAAQQQPVSPPVSPVVPQSSPQDPVAPPPADAAAAAIARRRAALQRALGQPAPGDVAPAAVLPVGQGGVPLPSALAGNSGMQSGPFRLLGISVDLMTAFGSSTEPDPVIQQLQGGHHDPRRRGFTLQQAELQFNGAIDPFFTGQFVLVSSLDAESNETIVEVEEAWLETLMLPDGFKVKAGHYLTSFGRINPVHPHAWDFQDQPVMLTRLFGEDGMRAPGAELTWLAPTETYFEVFLGVQDAHGETMASFLSSDEAYEERPLGGRSYPEGGAPQVRTLGDMVWHGRLATSFDPSASTTFTAGVSGLFGPNATGEGADTVIYGADFMWRWRPLESRRGYPFFKLQGELLSRNFDAAEQLDESDVLNPVTVAGDTLRDWGGYLYAVWGFDVGWALGLRGEYASGSGQSYAGGGDFDRAQDPFRADRLRISPMLSYQTSEFSRLRLQYNYDDSDHLPNAAHSLWLGFEILIGPHQPHSY